VQDHYVTLGVARHAARKEITRAYRRLALAHHPDRNPGDSGAAARFHAVQQAYDVLSDVAARAAYDARPARPGHVHAPPPPRRDTRAARPRHPSWGARLTVSEPQVAEGVSRRSTVSLTLAVGAAVLILWVAVGRLTGHGTFLEVLGVLALALAATELARAELQNVRHLRALGNLAIYAGGLVLPSHGSRRRAEAALLLGRGMLIGGALVLLSAPFAAR
jgi:hypothetical protein